MPVAYSYIRFSSVRQRRGTSEERQEETPEPWCQAHGYTLDKSLRLRDLGRSAFHGDHVKRGAMGVFLELVERGQIRAGSVLLIEDLDRFSRQEPYEARKHVDKIIDAGIDIVTLYDGERYSREKLNSDLGCSIKLTVALFKNHEDSDRKHKRLLTVWKKRREKAKDGLKFSRRCPTWIDKETGEVIQEKADLIRRAFKLASEGNGGNKIARVFNKEGLPTIGKAKYWSGALVQHYLRTRTVLGEYQPCRQIEGRDIPEGEPIAGFYTPIIDRHTYLTVQRVLDGRKKMVGRNTADAANLFTGLLVSLYDGGKYHIKNNADKRWAKDYRQKRLIPHKANEGVQDVMTITLDYDKFEGAFFNFVKEVDVNSLFVPKSQEDKAKELEALQIDLMELDDKIKATRTEARKAKNYRTLLTMIQDWEGERNDLAKKLEVLKSELVTSESRIFEDMRAALGDVNARPTVASYLRLLIDRIAILPIHIRTGRWKRADYLLYVEVHFHNGSVRWYVTDQDGVDQQGKGGPIGRTDLAKNPVFERYVILRGLIGQASDKWRPLLEKWLETSGRITDEAWEQWREDGDKILRNLK